MRVNAREKFHATTRTPIFVLDVNGYLQFDGPVHPFQQLGLLMALVSQPARLSCFREWQIFFENGHSH